MTSSSLTSNVADESLLLRKKIHPYDLSASDNPGTLISQVLLTGNNYEEWAREMRTALRARKKFGFVDGSIKKPKDDSSELEDWWTINSLLVSWIRNSIETSLRRDISFFEVAKDLWDDIAEQYGVVNGSRIHQLKFELVTCKQRSMTIKAYYGKLKKLWDDLGDYEKADVCTCNGCSCGAKGKAKQKQENDKVHQFLMGLDDVVYGGLRSTLLARDPLPTLNQVYSTLLQDETARQGPPGQTPSPEIASFAVQVGSRTRDSRRGEHKNSVCSACGKKGHVAESCYAVNGYPDWWKGARVTVAGGGSREVPSSGLFARSQIHLISANDKNGPFNYEAQKSSQMLNGSKVVGQHMTSNFGANGPISGLNGGQFISNWDGSINSHGPAKINSNLAIGGASSSNSGGFTEDQWKFFVKHFTPEKIALLIL